MTEPLIAVLLLPIGLGLVGFIEPCTIGSTLVFIKVMEGGSPSSRGPRSCLIVEGGLK